jgi:hypothetical protein
MVNLMGNFKLAAKDSEVFRAFFDLLLKFGDEWKVERVSANLKTEEVDVFLVLQRI